MLNRKEQITFFKHQQICIAREFHTYINTPIQELYRKDDAEAFRATYKYRIGEYLHFALHKDDKYPRHNMQYIIFQYDDDTGKEEKLKSYYPNTNIERVEATLVSIHNRTLKFYCPANTYFNKETSCLIASPTPLLGYLEHLEEFVSESPCVYEQKSKNPQPNLAPPFSNLYQILFAVL